MYKYLVLTVCLTALNLNGQSNELRVLAVIDHKIGYLNEEGEVAIPANFAAGGMFNDGLAPVRESGFYGYIDQNGSYALPPAYEYAEPFQNGLARVWNDGVPRLIDRRGCYLYFEGFAEMPQFYHHTYAAVKTKGGKYGLIDRTGCFLVDTVLGRRPTFDERGLAAVKAFDYVDEVGGFSFGIIDTTGSFVLPFTPLNGLRHLGNGYFEMRYSREWKKDDDGPTGIIGPDGRLTTNFYNYKWSPDDDEEISANGVIPARVYDVNMLTLRSWSSGDRLDHAALISVTGEIIMDNPEWEDISSFTDGRAFVYDTNNRFWLIDERGQYLSDTSFQAICGFNEWGRTDQDLFRNGEVIVKKGRYWYRMSSDLKLTRLPDFGTDIKLERSGDLLLLKEEQGRGGGDPYGNVHGWYDLRTGVLVLPRYEARIKEVAGTRWLTTQLDGRKVFLRRSGELIWQENEAVPIDYLNIDFMERADFEARQWRPKDAYQNVFQRLDINAHYLTPWMTASWLGNELKVFTTINSHRINIDVVNLTTDSLWFPAQDGTIELLLEARNENGEWQDIQYLGQSWCGNSYHTLALPPNHAWNFTAPTYRGAFETEVRLRLTYNETQNSEFRLKQYSNSVPVSINPAQFWRKPSYYSGGIMDPYLD